MREEGVFMLKRKESEWPDGQQTGIKDEQYPVYASAFEKSLTALETRLHSVEDPAEIAMGAIMDGAEFYGGDWCGIVEGDLMMEAWRPVLWYNVKKKGMTETMFKEMEEAEALGRYVEALKVCKPVIIPDTSLLKETNPTEYEIYQRNRAHSILAVPFWKNPVGFMLVRNPTRFTDRGSYLQVLAYVAFTSVTEQKLLARAKKSLAPENIRKDTDVYVRLFGGLEIFTSQGVLTGDELNSPKISRFLVYLLFHVGRAVIPRVACEEIWPEEEHDNPGNKVKRLAYRLQNAFSIISDYRLVVSSSQGYQLNPDLNIKTDVQLFDELRIQAQSAVTLQTKMELLKQCLELYRGEILPSASSEHWLMPQTLTYKYKCIGVYNELMQLEFESENFSIAQYYATEAARVEPDNPEAYYWMIRSLLRQKCYSKIRVELQMAKEALLENEYQELLQRLSISG